MSSKTPDTHRDVVFSWNRQPRITETLPGGQPIEVEKVILYQERTEIAVLEIIGSDRGETELTYRVPGDEFDSVVYIYGTDNLKERLQQCLGLTEIEAATAMEKFPDGVL